MKFETGLLFSVVVCFEKKNKKLTQNTVMAAVAYKVDHPE